MTRIIQGTVLAISVAMTGYHSESNAAPPADDKPRVFFTVLTDAGQVTPDERRTLEEITQSALVQLGYMAYPNNAEDYAAYWRFYCQPPKTKPPTLPANRAFLQVEFAPSVVPADQPNCREVSITLTKLTCQSTSEKWWLQIAGTFEGKVVGCNSLQQEPPRRSAAIREIDSEVLANIIRHLLPFQRL